MKVDRRNPLHWIRLCVFAAAVVAAILLRPLARLRRRGTRRVLFYGHRLAGNLQPLHDAIRAGAVPGVEAAFLTMDPAYWRTLLRSGEHGVLAGSLASVGALATADAIISDHGLHVMEPLLRWSNIRFFDVWHGIPFKGFDADDFRVQHFYDEAWVASPLLERLYVDRFGFDPAKVRVTGYARTDVLVRAKVDADALRREFSLPPTGKLVLFAPTWRQDDAGRQVFPFSAPPEEFLDAIASVAREQGATAILRLHLNTPLADVAERPGLHLLPFADYPATERLLLACDVLVCDWSSIAFDYLLLDRPTIFLDVPPPFRKGLSLDDTYRFGAIADGLPTMESLIRRFLAHPETYLALHGAQASSVRQRIYATFADGRSTQRCLDRLLAVT